MKKLALSLVAIAGLTSQVFAADMAVKALPPVAPIMTWTGFYLGINGGGGWGHSHWNNGVGSTDVSGGLAGVTAGYNWQTGNVVFGVEADGAWADVSASATGATVVPGFGVVTATASSKTDALGTVRGRVGYAVNNVLFYGTGGYAWIDNKITLSALGVSASDSKFHSGWTVGAGVEAFIAPQWSIKGEYLYRSLGGETYFTGALPTGTLNFHTVQFGVNYHFNGPIVAKY